MRVIERPADVFNREAEWRDLAAFAISPTRRLNVGLVYGRRRQGKSFLLRALTARTEGVYHQALEEERAGALERFGARLAERTELSGGRFAIRDWEEGFAALLRTAEGRQPLVVVLDEFPYLLRGSPELPSLIQRLADDTAATRGPAVRLILCGSAMSVMTSLLSGARALRGRATLDLVLDPFDYRAARSFWEIEQVDLAFQVHAILGGTPGYRDLLEGGPRSTRALARWLAAGVLNPSHALFREADYLLAEEPGITDRGLYNSVLAAIARGDRTPGKVAAALGRDEGALRHPLRMLEEARLIARDQDVLLQRRPQLRVTDPILRFHHAIVRTNLAPLEERRAAEVWTSAADTFSSQVLGPHFEEMARTWTARHASERTMGGRVERVGMTVLNDREERTRHQVDVVALGPGGRRRKTVRLLGEAKGSVRPMTAGDLRRLERVRSLLSTAGRADVSTARLALFARSGFTDDLLREAGRRTDVELIDLHRLYEGD